jgi:hypothetical protein
MEPLRQEVKSFVDACKHLLSLGPDPDLSPQDSDVIDHYLLEVNKLLYGDNPELDGRADAA